MSFSAAMPASLHQQLAGHLLRADGQEDVCLATYAPSTGTTRTSAVLGRAVLPGPGERAVHGNASFTGSYFVRATREAASAGRGVAALHSHPGGSGWQDMSGPDYDTERSYAMLVREITGLPLVGMTMAGDGSWSCRCWDPSGTPEHGESVRVPGSCFRVTWNDRLRPPPAVTGSQARTVSAWGETAQASLARIRVLVIGAGSVGLDVDVMATLEGEEARPTGNSRIEDLVRRFRRGDFDLVSVGRSQIGDPDWVAKISDDRVGEIRPFRRADIAFL